MSTLSSFISFLIYASSLLLVLFSCIPEKSQACDCKSNECILYNGTFLNLTSLRDLLVGQEDTIVSCFRNRSKYPANSKLYKDDTWSKGSLTVPIEQVPSPNCTKVLYPAGVCVNKNKKILGAYKSLLLLPNFTAHGVDGQYAATTIADRACLKAFWSRINLGRFVGETKFLNSTVEYSKLINARNITGIRDLLTNKQVEDAIVERVKLKAGVVLGQIVSSFYEKTVIPLTKDVEVDYLLLRLSKSTRCYA